MQPRFQQCFSPPAKPLPYPWRWSRTASDAGRQNRRPAFARALHKLLLTMQTRFRPILRKRLPRAKARTRSRNFRSTSGLSALGKRLLLQLQAFPRSRFAALLAVRAEWLKPNQAPTRRAKFRRWKETA